MKLHACRGRGGELGLLRLQRHCLNLDCAFWHPLRACECPGKALDAFASFSLMAPLYGLWNLLPEYKATQCFEIQMAEQLN